MAIATGSVLRLRRAQRVNQLVEKQRHAMQQLLCSRDVLTCGNHAPAARNEFRAIVREEIVPPVSVLPGPVA